MSRRAAASSGASWPGWRWMPDGRSPRTTWSRPCGATTRRRPPGTRSRRTSSGCAGWACRSRPRDDRYILEATTDVEEVERLAGASARRWPSASRRRQRRCLRAGPRRRPGTAAGRPRGPARGARSWRPARGARSKACARSSSASSSTWAVRPTWSRDARRLVDEQPYRERRWELLMLALYRAGRQAEALDAYAECRRRLLDDLGLDPGTGLRRMQQAVLAQDPAARNRRPACPCRVIRLRPGGRRRAGGPQPVPPGSRAPRPG